MAYFILHAHPPARRVTKVIVLDNLREGVLAPDIYDPAINPLYRDVLRHYNIVPLPCRVAESGSQGQGGEKRWPREKYAAERFAFRKPGGSAKLPRLLGDALG